METGTNTALEQKVAALAAALKSTRAELADTRRELRHLQGRRTRAAPASRLLYACCLILAGLALGVEILPTAGAQKPRPAPPPPQPGRFKAPFSVVNDSGELLFTITSTVGGNSTSLRLFGPGDSSGVISMDASAGDSTSLSVIGPGSPSAIATMTAGGTTELSLSGAGGKGAPSVRLYNSIQVPGPEQKAENNLSTVIDTKGFYKYANAGTGGGKSVVFLGLGNEDNGKFQLGNSAGDGMVEAGVLEGNKGVVRVYPCCQPTIPIPTFLMGMKQR